VKGGEKTPENLTAIEESNEKEEKPTNGRGSTLEKRGIAECP